MKWLNKYNNVLFAILGTLAIIVLLIAAFTSLSLFTASEPDNKGIDHASPVHDDLKNQDEGEHIEYLLGDPVIIDTNMSTYIIPVYKPEAKEPTGKFSSSSYRSELKINLIIHDFQNNQNAKLFNSIVLINSNEIIKIPGRIFIQVVYSDEDTNNNDIIDYDDKKSIGVYDMQRKAFNSIPLKEKYVSISSLYDQKLNALIIVGENFLPSKQPAYQFYRYSLETQQVFELENPM
jgi:hypothetical protein